MRASGVLMHISSLPGATGIGTFGKDAFAFADFLKNAGQSYWQILPLCPTGNGNSPYQSFSTFAGNPNFIDFDLLCDMGLLKKEEYKSINWGGKTKVDFKTQKKYRIPILKKAFERFDYENSGEYSSFCRENSYWLDDYALYCALKEENGSKEWTEWEKPIRNREKKALQSAEKRLSREIAFHKCVQFFFDSQWSAVKKYANENGIKIIGDVPIYVAGDSADVWANPKNFLLDSEGAPTEVAGCPPDAFSDLGQLWGNPLYDWDYMKSDGYSWWENRLRRQIKLCDVVRIDHFRGFESYYCIPADAPNAINGEWRKGPGAEFFKIMEEKLGKMSLIAEDLGFLTPQVKRMLKKCGYPGMKVLQFAFDSPSDNDYTLHNITKNSVVYVGTHDNDTALGFIKNAPRAVKKRAKDYMRLSRREGYGWGMMKTAWSSGADTAIVTMQDLLELGGEARMNTPSTTVGNWEWRAESGSFTSELAEKTRYYTGLYFRLEDKNDKDSKGGAKSGKGKVSKRAE